MPRGPSFSRIIQSETECDYRLWASNAAPVACLFKKMMFLPKIVLIYDKPLLKVAAQLRVEMFSEKKDETTLIANKENRRKQGSSVSGSIHFPVVTPFPKTATSHRPILS